MRRITLLTDFGTRDGYVGAMKGVIASIHPSAVVDDIAHDLAPGDVAAAALALVRYWDRFPGGTVHVAVVDPGVGTSRRALALEADRRFFVVPDNGIASRVIEAAEAWRAVSIESPEVIRRPRSATFHGRDVFAPAAAFLARGIHLFRLGPRVDDPILRAEPAVLRTEGEIRGEVIALDRFGNLITNVPGTELESADGVEVEGRRIPLGRTYGQVQPLEPVALINSDGRLEVGARDSSAAELLGAEVGTPVRILVDSERDGGKGGRRAGGPGSPAGGASYG
jgi:S-adenosyl-L-methionine hydrolase (adenosine-forming)